MARTLKLPNLKNYRFGEVIGGGGTGTVYRGVERATRRPVAIKVLHETLFENATAHQRLAQEFRAATQLEHPNIVRAIEMDTDGTTSFLVYELIDGMNLGDKVREAGPLSEDDAIRVITQIAQALHYAHARQVVHRDVKPDNILVLADGRAKLTDFGLAKDYNNDLDLTRRASGLGTPNYMAPEQFADAKSVGPASDVYSLGATLYAALTGMTPFHAKFPLAILAKKEKELPSARAVVPAVSERVDLAIQAALQPEPADRPATCLEFFKLLTARTRFDGDSGVRPSPRPRAESGSDRRAWVRHPLEVGTCGGVEAAVCGGGDTQEWWPLVVRDVSGGGVGVRLARRFEPGTELAIELPTDSGPRRLPARVVRIEPETVGHWVHGCVFPTPLTDEELAALLSFC